MKGYGLNPTPKDERDFHFEKVFGAAQPFELPREYTVSKPIDIKDQGPTDMCTAYASTAVSEDQEGILLDPFYTFARTKQIAGGDRSLWGADLRVACKAVTGDKGYGFRPASLSPRFKIEKSATQEDRDMAVRWEDLTVADDNVAAKYKKKSFFAVNYVGDFFNGIRSALWQARSEERSVFIGIDWKPEWSGAKDGIVERVGSGQSYGHAIKIFGWEYFRNDPYLIAQLSNGKQIGKEGIFLLSQQVINLEGRYGGFTFMDMPREQAEYELGKVGWVRYWFRSIFS